MAGRGDDRSGAGPDGVAELMLSVCLGLVAQRALAGDADVQAHVGALKALNGAGGPSGPARAVTPSGNYQ